MDLFVRVCVWFTILTLVGELLGLDVGPILGEFVTGLVFGDVLGLDVTGRTLGDFDGPTVVGLPVMTGCTLGDIVGYCIDVGVLVILGAFVTTGLLVFGEILGLAVTGCTGDGDGDAVVGACRLGDNVGNILGDSLSSSLGGKFSGLVQVILSKLEFPCMKSRYSSR